MRPTGNTDMPQITHKIFAIFSWTYQSGEIENTTKPFWDFKPSVPNGPIQVWVGINEKHKYFLKQNYIAVRHS